METVPRLYREARPGSEFERSLDLLRGASERRDRGDYDGRVKTGLMLGLGEDDLEVRSTIAGIRDAGVEILTLGQYLQPTREHLPVRRWVHPDQFAALRDFALGLGFAHCEAGPLVRSSYHAHEHLTAGSRS
jgi:lipoic acid synthetase